jgi:hypothetical protein
MGNKPATWSPIQPTIQKPIHPRIADEEIINHAIHVIGLQ